MALLENQIEELEADPPRPFLWEQSQYHKMREMGWFVDTPVELLEGDVMEMYPETPDGEPRRRPWTKEQFYAMGEMGWFRDARVEFMDGEVYEMPAISAGHWKSTILVGKVMRTIFGEGYTVAEQTSFDGGRRSEPQPDMAVYQGDVRDFQALPTHALLVVEVSKSTLTYDRTHKASLYASRGIGDYWIVNLRSNVLEVHRQPTTRDDGTSLYAEVTTLKKFASISPLAAPHSVIKVADLLP